MHSNSDNINHNSTKKFIQGRKQTFFHQNETEALFGTKQVVSKFTQLTYYD